MQTRTGHFCNTVKTTNLQKQQRLDRGLHLFWAKKNKAVSARLPNRCTYNPTQRRNAAKSMIADETVKVKGGTIKPKLEALYEGLCRRELALFEPEALHKQLDALTSAVSKEALEALLQLCEDWQKHAFAVGFTAAVRLLTK